MNEFDPDSIHRVLRNLSYLIDNLLSFLLSIDSKTGYLRNPFELLGKFDGLLITILAFDGPLD